MEHGTHTRAREGGTMQLFQPRSDAAATEEAKAATATTTPTSAAAMAMTHTLRERPLAFILLVLTS